MTKTKILIVEDEYNTSEMLKEKLTKFGYFVCGIVSSRKEATKIAKLKKPDLVLMDIKLRGRMDGIEVAEKIYNNYNTPVIYVTAYADESTLSRIKQTVPYGFIVKPFEPKELRGVIETAIYKHEMENRIKESEERFRMLVETMNDGLGVQDEKS